MTPINAFVKPAIRVLFPVLVDLAVYRCFSSRIKDPLVPATLSGLCTVLILSRNSYAGIAAYLAFKAAQAAFIYWPSKKENDEPFRIPPRDDKLAAALTTPVPSNRPKHPDLIEVEARFADFKEKLTITYPGEWNFNYGPVNQFAESVAMRRVMREKWKGLETEARQVVELAAAKFNQLFDEMWSKTDPNISPEQRYQKMAEMLTSQKHENDFYKRFGSQLTWTLLRIYRYIRKMSYSVNIPKKSDGQMFYSVNLTPEDVKPYNIPGSNQYRSRKAYNQAIEKWLPVMQYLTKDKRYLAWVIKDEKDFPDSENNPFMLNPGSLPS